MSWAQGKRGHNTFASSCEAGRGAEREFEAHGSTVDQCSRSAPQGAHCCRHTRKEECPLFVPRLGMC